MLMAVRRQRWGVQKCGDFPDLVHTNVPDIRGFVTEINVSTGSVFYHLYCITGSRFVITMFNVLEGCGCPLEHPKIEADFAPFG